MPVWPKSFYTFGVSVRTAATEWKLRRKSTGIPEQERTFQELVARLGRTKFWREAGVEPSCKYAGFQSRVAPRNASALAPAVERMIGGEADVLWPGVCDLFIATPGTNSGAPTHLPVTEPLLRHVQQSAFESILYYTVRARHAGVFRGRHLWVGGSTALKPLHAGPARHAYVAPGTALLTVGLPPWVEKHLYEPGAAVAQIDDWSKMIEAIAARTCQADISLFAAMPRWAVLLGRILRERGGTAMGRRKNLQELWPNLECFVHTGVPIRPFYDELRDLLGPAVRFHEIYLASEAFIAAQDGEPAAGLRLMTGGGVFFEFMPLGEFDESRLEYLGPRLVPLAGVKTGIDYALFVTTPGGLARHSLGDVVRFISTTPPRLIYVGRTGLRLHAFGENVMEKEITDALVAVCQRHKWNVVNFHVAPLFTASLTGANRGRHEWWVELNAGTVATPMGPQLAEELDVELQRMNPKYAAKRKTNALEPPFVRLVMPGVFEHWLRFHSKWGGQHKTPRCRSDRLVADELAQITNFARD